MFLELLEESYYQYAKFAAKGFEYKYMSYTVALLRAMFIYLFVYRYHFLKAQAIINDHLEHRRQERVEDPREYKSKRKIIERINNNHDPAILWCVLKAGQS